MVLSSRFLCLHGAPLAAAPCWYTYRASFVGEWVGYNPMYVVTMRGA